MPELPSTVRIGWKRFAIVENVDLNLEGASGQIRYLKDEIALMPNLQPQARLFVLWHEVLHGILDSGGSTGEEHNEQIIDRLANGVIQVLRDNPDLVNMTLGVGE